MTTLPHPTIAESVSTVSSAYLLDNAMRHAHERLQRLEAAYDPGTFRVLDRLGVGAGWRCLEVGAGAGSVACWLSDRVGRSGSVLATDLDPRFIAHLADGRPQLQIRQHDIVTDSLPGSPFDLIHARMVLEHIPARETALARMVEALAPGGWLVIEAIDFGAEYADPGNNAAYQELFARLHGARIRLLADRGFDHEFARGLPRRFRGLGLTAIETEGRASTWTGGSAGSDVWRLSIEQLRETFLAAGYLRDGEIGALLTMVRDPDFAATSPLVMAAWGQRIGS